EPMRAVFAFLLAILFPIGVWMVLVAYPRFSLRATSDQETLVPVRQEPDPGVRWMSGVVRAIDPRTGTVLLQTEKGPVRLLASAQVLHSRTEGAMVSAYIAADELVTTVQT